MTPDFLPRLATGNHTDPSQGACVMEYVSVLAGEPFTDAPACTHPVLAAAAIRVNDSLNDADRALLVPLIGRLFGTPPTGTDLEQRVLSVRLAVWSARNVAHLVLEEDWAVCAAAVDAAEAWADNPNAANAANARATRDDAADAAYAARSAVPAYAFHAASAASATASAAYAAASAFHAASDASRHGVASAAYAAASAIAGVRFLTGLLDEHTRLTGHTAVILSEAERDLLLSAIPQPTR